NVEQRAVIKFNAKLGKSASETFRLMQIYGNQCLGRTAVFAWHKRFLEGRETLEDDKKSGRSNTMSMYPYLHVTYLLFLYTHTHTHTVPTHPYFYLFVPIRVSYLHPCMPT
ncbi:hypothetical protein ALC56_11905, partial [Trachymyrmex septentrionalis]